MLKFFRKYNTWMLGIGGSLLMIVFLITPVMSMFKKDPNKFALGTYDGGELTVGERKNAELELMALRYCRLIFDPDGDPSADNAKRWALVLADAHRLGLNASFSEVRSLQIDAGLSDADVERLAARFSGTPSFIRQAMRHWLIVQQYKELMAGQAHLSGRARADLIRQAVANPQQAVIFQALALGWSRMSRPLEEHFVQDLGASVTGRAVVIPADQFLEDTPKPSDEQVQQLFGQYKTDLPGEGQPYPFGYRIPDRVKLEYMVFSLDEAKRHVKVTEADALAYYRANPDKYRGAGKDAEVKPYNDVRSQVIQDVTDQQAFDMVQNMAKSAQALFFEDTRSLSKQDGYRVIENPAKLSSMRQVAESLEQEYGLLPQVRFANSGGWVNAQDLPTLPGIGDSWLAFHEDAYKPELSFKNYVLSDRELLPKEDNPLLTDRLQANLAGSTLRDPQGSRYIFRITEAQPTRVPELDEVRPQVEEDAWQLAAYKRLVSDSKMWLNQAVADGLKAVAGNAHTAVTDLPACQRRSLLLNGQLTLPHLPSIGQSEAFIDAYFKTAVSSQRQGDLSALPSEDVTGVVGLDQQLALAVYRVDDYQPITHAQFKQQSTNPYNKVYIDKVLIGMNPMSIDNPLSYEALVKRLNYKEASRSADEEGQAPGAEAEQKEKKES